MSPTAEPCLLVIFGAMGDLAHRMLFPALDQLLRAGLMSDRSVILGTARRPLTDEKFREALAKSGVSEGLRGRCHYLSGDGGDPQMYAKLQEYVAQYSTQQQSGNVIFYLAIPPELFTRVPELLAKQGLLHQDKGWRRVIFEKPFGEDLPSSRELNRRLTQFMKEEQIYRIDHYLGKETVQNIMVLRFANAIFEPIWNRRYIDSVQISVMETLAVGSRGAYYDRAGALRDMIPNHLFQLLALTAMEPPNSFGSDDVRSEKVKALRAIRGFSHEDVIRYAVRGQYEGYREEKGINPNSSTETYAALRLEIDNWRWAGVPFYLRTGKKLRRRLTEVAIRFREVPHQLFRKTDCGPLESNHLVIGIQPEEETVICFGAKRPGPDLRVEQVGLEFNYRKVFEEVRTTGYETLLYDCMRGDATLFQRVDQIEAGWSVVQPVIEVWKALQPEGFPDYASQSWGPEAGSALLARDGREWRNFEPAPEAPQFRRKGEAA